MSAVPKSFVVDSHLDESRIGEGLSMTKLCICWESSKPPSPCKIESLICVALEKTQLWQPGPSIWVVVLNMCYIFIHLHLGMDGPIMDTSPFTNQIAFSVLLFWHHELFHMPMVWVVVDVNPGLSGCHRATWIDFDSPQCWIMPFWWGSGLNMFEHSLNTI